MIDELKRLAAAYREATRSLSPNIRVIGQDEAEALAAAVEKYEAPLRDRISELEAQVAALQLAGGAALGNIAKSKLVAANDDNEKLRMRIKALEDVIASEARRTTNEIYDLRERLQKEGTFACDAKLQIEIYENTLCAIGVELGKPDPTDIVSTLRARLKELIDEKQKRLAAENMADQANLALGKVATELGCSFANPDVLSEIKARKKDHGDCQRALQRIEAMTAPTDIGRMSPSQVADKVREMRDELLVTQNTLRTLEKLARDLLAARSAQSWPEHRFFDALIAFFSERAGTCNKGPCNEHCELSRGHAGPHLYRSPCPPCDEKPMPEKCDYQEDINGDVARCRRRRGHSGPHTYSVNEARKLDNVLSRDDMIDALEFALRLAHGLNTANMLKNLIQYLRSGS